MVFRMENGNIFNDSSAYGLLRDALNINNVCVCIHTAKQQQKKEKKLTPFIGKKFLEIESMYRLA